MSLWGFPEFPVLRAAGCVDGFNKIRSTVPQKVSLVSIIHHYSSLHRYSFSRHLTSATGYQTRSRCWWYWCHWRNTSRITEHHFDASVAFESVKRSPVKKAPDSFKRTQLMRIIPSSHSRKPSLMNSLNPESLTDLSAQTCLWSVNLYRSSNSATVHTWNLF